MAQPDADRHKGAEARVFPVPAGILTDSLCRPSGASRDRASMRSIRWSRSMILPWIETPTGRGAAAVRQEAEGHVLLSCVSCRPSVRYRDGVDAGTPGSASSAAVGRPCRSERTQLACVLSGSACSKGTPTPFAQVPACIFRQPVDHDAREGIRRTDYTAVQGSTTSTSMPSKSRTLRVTTAMLRERAIAAI